MTERASALSSLDNRSFLRDFPEWNLTLILSEGIEERAALFRFHYMLLRGGAHRTYIVSARDIKRRLLVNLRSRWSLADMISFRLRTIEPISRAVMRKA